MQTKGKNHSRFFPFVFVVFGENAGGTFFMREKHRNVPLLRKYFASEILQSARTPFKKALTKIYGIDLSVRG